MSKVFVESSNIDYVEYHKEDSSLEVGFKNGRVYAYLDVAKPVYDDFILSESKGKFFNTYIKESYEWLQI